ncbi:Tyrosine+recombinase+XerC [Methylocapsa aurea]|jgi:integrase|uniref:tyrosine-type recombinase/integrase n=1 Tax=Methylocapsa aurea TaxID=663610 RepID=UPI003D18C917
MREKITKRTVEAIEPSVRDTFLWDSEIPGFGCKVTPKGGRIYLLQYSQGGRDHRVTIGRHGVEFTAEQARNEARRLRGLIASGENPAQVRSHERSVPTIAALGERYLEEYAGLHKKPSALAQDKRNLQNHIKPLIGTLKVSDVERQDISRVMREIAAGKTAKDEKTKRQGRRIVRGGEIVANRVHALLSKMFQLAEDWKYRPAGSNPCRGAKRFAEHKVERYLSVDELARLGRALNAAKEGRLIVDPDAVKPAKRKRGGQKKLGPRSENPYAVAAIELLLLTGCRLGEVLNLRWSDVDIERRFLLLPDSKTGAKTVYLSEAAISTIGKISRNPKSLYLFPGKSAEEPLRSIRVPWEHICKAAGLENLRLHDLRHSFASVGAASGLSLPMIGALLGHSQPTTTARYAHLAASPLHQAVDEIGTKISQAMNLSA